MYNLTVAQDHTYAVVLEQWIVHNDNGGGPQFCGGGGDPEPVTVFLPSNRYPQTAAHIQDLEGGVTDIYHWDPAWTDVNRDESLDGYPTIPGFDRDEWPMAATQEGGDGADIRYISSSDNRGAGSFIAQQLGPNGYNVNPGDPFIIVIISEFLF
jgi:hypothetical protein